MTAECEWVQANAAQLVRDAPQDGAPESIEAHVASCAACEAVVAGARSLGRDLDRWESAAPADDLVARTMARLALANAQPVGASLEGEGRIVPMPRRRRRTTVELLTSAALPGEDVAADPPPRRRLLMRLFVQSAAALVLFGVCTSFVAVFYPAVTHALEDGRVTRCQQRLVRLQQAAVRYHQERPDAHDLRGPDLRQALIQGGYADPLDFICPGHKGRDMRERSYVGFLPGGAAPVTSSTPIYWDRFGNHSSGFNVVYGDGKVEQVRAEDFAAWRSAKR